LMMMMTCMQWIILDCLHILSRCGLEKPVRWFDYWMIYETIILAEKKKIIAIFCFLQLLYLSLSLSALPYDYKHYWHDPVLQMFDVAMCACGWWCGRLGVYERERVCVWCRLVLWPRAKTRRKQDISLGCWLLAEHQNSDFTFLALWYIIVSCKWIFVMWQHYPLFSFLVITYMCAPCGILSLLMVNKLCIPYQESFVFLILM
jgi:hypothetical protein